MLTKERLARMRAARKPMRQQTAQYVTENNRAEYLEYFRVAQGEPYPVAPDLYESTAHVEGRDWIIERAVRAIWQFNKTRNLYDCGEDYVPAIDIIAHGLGIDPERATLAPRPLRKTFWAMVSLALAKARQDTRYWGVEDPNVERYCSECRKVKAVELFNQCEWMCDDCTDKENKRGEEKKGRKTVA